MVRSHRFVVLVLRALPALCKYSDTYDDVVLLQMKHSMSSLDAKHQPLTDAETWFKRVNKKGVAVDLVELETRLERLCQPAGSCGAGIALIEDTLQPYLVQEALDDAATITAAVHARSRCISHRDARFENASDVGIAWHHSQTAKTKHKLCLKAQKSWQDVVEHQATLCLDGTPSTLGQLSQTHDMLALSISNTRTDMSAYSQAEPVGQNDCVMDQLRYEDVFCSARLTTKTAIATADACIASAGVMESHQQVATREADRSRLWDALQRIKCHFSDEETNDNDYLSSNCSIADPNPFLSKDPTELVIPGVTAVPTLPGESESTWSQVPSMEDTVACQAWLQNYAFGSDHWPVSACLTTCAEPAPVLPIEVLNCKDLDAQCTFFRFHDSSCGLYDTDSFTSGQQCCACGGGQSDTDTAVSGPLTVDQVSSLDTAFVIEFCEGPRTGQQFAFTLPTPDESWFSHSMSHYGSGYCYPHVNNSHYMSANYYLAWVQHGGKPSLQAATANCATGRGSGVRFKEGSCSGEFQQILTINKPCPYPSTENWWCGFDATMTALGGLGWEIFSTIGESERYKFVSVPLLLRPEEDEVGS